jgi:hypothetical protein
MVEVFILKNAGGFALRARMSRARAFPNRMKVTRID